MEIYDLPDDVLEAIAHAGAWLLLTGLDTPGTHDKCSQHWQQTVENRATKLGSHAIVFPRVLLFAVMRMTNYANSAGGTGRRKQRCIQLCELIGNASHSAVFMVKGPAGNFYVDLYNDVGRQIRSLLPQEMQDVIDTAIALEVDSSWEEAADKAALFAAT